MNQSTRIFAAALLAGFTCFSVSGITMAQDKAKDAKAAPAAEKGKPATKVLFENEKVKITQSTFLPGDVSTADRKPRAVFYVTGGEMQRVSKDGKKTINKRVAGSAVWMEADSDVVTNIGKTKMVLTTVVHK